MRKIYEIRQKLTEFIAVKVAVRISSNQQSKVHIYIELLKKRIHEKSRHSKTVQATAYLFMSTYIVLFIDY